MINIYIDIYIYIYIYIYIREYKDGITNKVSGYRKRG